MLGYREKEDKRFPNGGEVPDSGPIEPESKKGGKQNLLKWLFFLFVIIYVLISHYHTPILTYLGRYLIVQNQPQNSDLIVCLAGGAIERGLATADAFHNGLAPFVFVSMEEPPDGFELLEAEGINYPESIDLLIMILKQRGVPESAIFKSDRPVISTFDEAEVVKNFADSKGIGSIILITSPTHSRRALWTFNRVFEGDDVRILMIPSEYSRFNPEDWWKKRRYFREVIIEYQKLVYYLLKYF